MSWNKHDLNEIFSDREREILKAIGSSKRLTIELITDKVFADNTDKPFDAQISIGNSIRRIVKKCDAFNLHFTLKKTRTDGKLIITKETI